MRELSNEELDAVSGGAIGQGITWEPVTILGGSQVMEVFGKTGGFVTGMSQSLFNTLTPQQQNTLGHKLLATHTI